MQTQSGPNTDAECQEAQPNQQQQLRRLCTEKQQQQGVPVSCANRKMRSSSVWPFTSILTGALKFLSREGTGWLVTSVNTNCCSSWSTRSTMLFWPASALPCTPPPPLFFCVMAVCAGPRNGRLQEHWTSAVARNDRHAACLMRCL